MTSSIADLFDFANWLKEKDPGQDWTISPPLAGALTNLTVRAQRTDTSTPSAFRDNDTLILKFAPPFIAALGPAVPFSEFRQTIEARALALLHAEPALACGAGPVRVPRLLAHDAAAHVLALEDLGADLLPLDRWLATAAPHDARAVGCSLGAFLARLHTAPALAVDARAFESADSRAAIAGDMVQNVRARLEEAGVRDAAAVADIVKSAYATQVPRSMLAFSVGDLWPGSVLVAADRGGAAVIDYEFAGPARPLADMAQLAAHLHLMLLAATPSQATVIQAFVDGLHTAYREGAVAHGAKWMGAEVLPQMIALAWILHGREMVNNAGEYAQGNAGLLGRMVETGAGYVRGGCEPSRGVAASTLAEETFLSALYAGR